MNEEHPITMSVRELVGKSASVPSMTLEDAKQCAAILKEFADDMLKRVHESHYGTVPVEN